MIGGFIILFSVVNKLLFDLQITLILAKLIGSVFTIFHLPSALSVPTVAGLFEITLGNQLTSKVQEASLMHKAIIASFILGFSGFSVQAQVASILAQTDIRFRPFFLARVLHGFVSGALTFILWKPIANRFFITSDPVAVPVFLQEYDHWWESVLRKFIQMGPLFTILSLLLCIVVYVNRMDVNK